MLGGVKIAPRRSRWVGGRGQNVSWVSVAKHFTIGRVTVVLLVTAVVCLGPGSSCGACVLPAAQGGTLSQGASISPYVVATVTGGEQVIAASGGGFTPNHAISSSEPGQGPAAESTVKGLEVPRACRFPRPEALPLATHVCTWPR